MRRSGQADPLVVSAKELAAVIIDWQQKHDSEHPYIAWSGIRNVADTDMTGTGTGSIGEREPIQVGAFRYISMHTNHADDRFLRRITRGETKWVTLRMADEILAVIGEVHALHDGRIRVVPNPRWSTESYRRWREEEGGAC